MSETGAQYAKLYDWNECLALARKVRDLTAYLTYLAAGLELFDGSTEPQR